MTNYGKYTNNSITCIRADANSAGAQQFTVIGTDTA
jgi:hypothetical protein